MVQFSKFYNTYFILYFYVKNTLKNIMYFTYKL